MTSVVMIPTHILAIPTTGSIGQYLYASYSRYLNQCQKSCGGGTDQFRPKTEKIQETVTDTKSYRLTITGGGDGIRVFTGLR